MQESQVNTFGGGLDFDSDPRVIKNDRYINALNVETMSVEKSGMNAINPMQSSALAFTLPSVIDQVQFTKVRYTENVDIVFYFYDSTGALLGQGVISAANNTDFMAFYNLFMTTMLSYGYDVQDFQLSADGKWILFSIEFGGNPVRVSFLWEVDGSFYEEIVIQEAYTASVLNPIATWNVEDRLFVFSTTGSTDAIEIGIASKSGTWSYTRILRTWRFLLPTTEAIDIRVEKVSNQSWALYWTNNNKPKVLYIPEAYTQDCVAKYNTTDWDTPTSGYIIYNEANEQTNLQLINNAGLVTYSDQLQNGGALVSGGYRYSVRFGINGTENTTEWSVLTPNVIPVYKTSTTSPSAYIRIQGDKGGTATSKANVLLVQNALPNIYNFVELACVYNSGGVDSAYIVGRFNVTDSEFTVTHTGAETGTITLDTTLLPQTDPVVLKAKTLEIKKNRLNLANLEIGADDPAIAAIASAASIGQAKYAMAGIGALATYDNTILNLSAAAEGADTHWTATLPAWQSTSGILKLTTLNTPINPNYNPVTGLWVVSSSEAGNYNLSFTFSLLEGGSFSGNPILVSLKRQPVLGGAFETLISKQVTYIVGSKQQSPQSASTTVTLNAGDTVCLTTDGNIVGAVGVYVDTNTKWQAVALTSASLDFKSTTVGEYQLPENCATKVGYMLNETYALFMRVHYKNGYISSPYFIGYFNPTQDPLNSQVYTNSISSSTYSTYAYYAKINGIDITSIKNNINGISIWRAVCNPTVLGSGVLFTGDDMSGSAFRAGYYASIPTTPGDYGSKYGATAIQRRYGMFFSHDTRIAKLAPNRGDIISYWSPATVLNSVSTYKSGSNFLGGFGEYYGEAYSAIPTATDINVVDGRYVDFAEAIGVYNPSSPQIVSTYGVSTEYYQPNININSGVSGSMENVALGFDNYVTSGAALSLDNGVYMAQYKRTVVGNQYDIESVKIVPTGTYIPVNSLSSNILNDISVFGGDTYTQKNILKVRYWSDYGDGVARSSFITYYAQNKINTQLFYCDESEGVKASRNLQGWKSITSYLFPYAIKQDVVEEQFNYDKGFSADYPLFITAYNSKLPSESKFISRIYYSQQKPINSLQDFYRKVLAIDFRDLDTKNGHIAALRDVNNYMVAVQPRAVSVLPYLSDVAIGTQGGGEVLIGTGGVYNQRENIISTYGTGLQTCTFVGNNNNGNSTLYWFSPEFKKYCRYGGDGIRILSDENSMRSFFLTMNAIEEYDMIQVFDIEHASVIMTWNGVPKTLLFNERNNNFSTFASFYPERYFSYQNLALAPANTNQVYELFGGTGVLQYLGEAASTFMIEYVANKGGMSDKRFLSTALSVGTGYSFTNPTVNMSVNGDSVFPHAITTYEKRFENWFGAFNKSGGQQPIGQYGIVRVESSAYILLLGAVTKFRNIFRSLFK